MQSPMRRQNLAQDRFESPPRAMKPPSLTASPARARQQSPLKRPTAHQVTQSPGQATALVQHRFESPPRPSRSSASAASPVKKSPSHQARTLVTQDPAAALP